MSKVFKSTYTTHHSNVWFGSVSGFLWAGGFVGWVQYVTKWSVNPRIWGDCKLYKFLFFFCEHYSSALLVIMSIEKFFASYFPLKTRSVCTVRTSRWVSGITALVFVAFNAQAFSYMKLEPILEVITSVFIFVCQKHTGWCFSVSIQHCIPLALSF